MTTIETTRAPEVPINLWDYNRLKVIATFTSDGAAVDLTNHKFEFILKKQDIIITTYTINSGDLVSEFIEKQGASHNILYMRAMLEDIRDRITKGSAYRLIMKVTEPSGDPYIYVIHPIHDKQH